MGIILLNVNINYLVWSHFFISSCILFLHTFLTILWEKNDLLFMAWWSIGKMWWCHYSFSFWMKRFWLVDNWRFVWGGVQSGSHPSTYFFLFLFPVPLLLDDVFSCICLSWMLSREIVDRGTSFGSLSCHFCNTRGWACTATTCRYLTWQRYLYSLWIPVICIDRR